MSSSSFQNRLGKVRFSLPVAIVDSPDHYRKHSVLSRGILWGRRPVVFLSSKTISSTVSCSVTGSQWNRTKFGVPQT
jgi:hypothetical protein